jgi:hypothetical protein
MRKTFSHTLHLPALDILRRACYARMELDIQYIGATLETGMPQRTRHAMAANDHLKRTAGLLDRIGWTEDDIRPATLNNHQDVEHAITVLRDEAAAESAVRAAALEDKATNAADRATHRELAIHDILTSLEATLDAAIINGVAAAVAEHPSA